MTDGERSEASVYRMLDATGRLLYVGMSTNVPQRLAAHRSQQEWWPRVALIEVLHFAGRKAAAAEERRAIADDEPEFNVAPGRCVTWNTIAERDQHVAETRERLERERFERTFWRPEGTIRCGNCDRRPEWFPKGKALEEVTCKRCGCTAFERTLAVVRVEGRAA